MVGRQEDVNGHCFSKHRGKGYKDLKKQLMPIKVAIGFFKKTNNEL